MVGSAKDFFFPYCAASMIAGINASAAIKPLIQNGKVALMAKITPATAELMMIDRLNVDW